MKRRKRGRRDSLPHIGRAGRDEERDREREIFIILISKKL